MSDASRTTIRIQLRVPSKKKLDTLCDRRGMTQIAVMSRLVDWFVEQDDMIQGSVLGHFIVHDKSDIAQMLVDHMLERSLAAKKRKK